MNVDPRRVIVPPACNAAATLERTWSAPSMALRRRECYYILPRGGSIWYIIGFSTGSLRGDIFRR